MRYLVCLGLLAFPACAQDLTAQQVLDKIVSTYNNLHAVHLLAERTETRSQGGRIGSEVSECEIAAKPNHRYYVRLKQLHDEATSVSDGSAIWKAIDSKKQWSKVTAAALTTGKEEEDAGEPPPSDLHHAIESVLLYRPLLLAKHGQDAEIAKEPEFKLGHEKIRCYLLRGRDRQIEFELLVDKQRFLVLEYKQKAKAPGGAVEIDTRLKLAELDDQVADSLFHFEPSPQWAEVETLTLPGERAVILTGERAADFTLKTLDGETVGLRGLEGNVVVLDFWATWCGPCRAEMPAIEKLRAEFADGVRFYGVNDEAPGTVKRFIAANHYEMAVLVDERDMVHRLYGVRAIPSLLVIDKNSVVRAQFMGTQSESTLRMAIRAALEEK